MAISLLFVTVIYSGMTTNVYATPDEIPGLQDMLLPSLWRYTNSVFATLTSPLNSHLSPRAVVAVWFSCICLLGFFSALAIRLAKSRFEKTKYKPVELESAIRKMARQMRWDLFGASACSLAGLVAVIVISLEQTLSSTNAYTFALPTAGGLALGLYNQRRQAKALEAGLRGSSHDGRPEP